MKLNASIRYATKSDKSAAVALPIQNTKRFINWALLISLLGSLAACEKLIDVSAPATSIPQSYVFASDKEAIGALAGAYYKMINTNEATLLNGGMTIYAGLASDELLLSNQGDAPVAQFAQNKLQPGNPILGILFWEASYQSIYQFNVILEGVADSKTLTPTIKEQLTGHALFGRALMYYHLSSVFGPVPFVTSTDWRTTSMQKREPLISLYSHLITDLERAQQLLPTDYNLMGGGKATANKWAATTLLAKLLAITNDWEKVLMQCDKVLESRSYLLAPTPSDVFLLNSPEAILQLKQDNTAYMFNATREGVTLVPIDGIFPFPPFAYLSAPLLATFEPGDLRKVQWVGVREIAGRLLHYPYKYKMGPSQAKQAAPITEGYMVLRLAEVLLLRAEARVKNNNLLGAIEDVNQIRRRAGLTLLAGNLSKDQVENALHQERRIELFCEWGHRWVDLRRWNQAEQVLSANKGTQVSPAALVFPIPANELSTNPGLDQNPGY